MGKKEKVVELKPKVEKISDEHLKDLQTIVNIVNNLQYKIGQIEGQKHNLLHELSLSQKKIVDLQNTFEKEYGTFDINVADGKINWEKDEK
jgi:hypothetical protein